MPLSMRRIPPYWGAVVWTESIHRAGGPAILEACRRIRDRQGGCRVGEAVLTTAGRLPAKYVIHTVGPVWSGGERGEAGLLQRAYENSLELAAQNAAISIAFPGISTGIYHYPKEKAAQIAIQTTRAFLKSSVVLQKVIFVCFDDENFAIYRALLYN